LIVEAEEKELGFSAWKHYGSHDVSTGGEEPTAIIDQDGKFHRIIDIRGTQDICEGVTMQSEGIQHGSGSHVRVESKRTLQIKQSACPVKILIYSADNYSSDAYNSDSSASYAILVESNSSLSSD